MTEHDHHHDHDHSDLSETELRVRALETILTEKGYVEPAALDAIIQAYETKIGPHQGRGPARPCQPRRRSSRRCREHTAAPQHGRVHTVLLLPLGNAGASARL